MLLCIKNKWQTRFASADDNDLRVGRCCQLLCCLDSLPVQELLTDTECDNFLKIRNPLGFNPLPLCFLPLFREDKLHPLALLIGSQFLFNGSSKVRWQPNAAQWRALNIDAPRLNLCGKIFLNKL